jgi:hypothetical protein
MERKRLVAGGGALVVVGLVAFVVMRERKTWKSPAHDSHAAGVEYRLAPLVEMSEAPEGATPCETVWNAFKAFDDASKVQNGKTPYGVLPDKATLIARCQALPEQEQKCLEPRYFAKNHPICDPIAAKYKDTNPLFPESTK